MFVGRREIQTRPGQESSLVRSAHVHDDAHDALQGVVRLIGVADRLVVDGQADVLEEAGGDQRRVGHQVLFSHRFLFSVDKLHHTQLQMKETLHQTNVLSLGAFHQKIQRSAVKQTRQLAVRLDDLESVGDKVLGGPRNDGLSKNRLKTHLKEDKL